MSRKYHLSAAILGILILGGCSDADKSAATVPPPAEQPTAGSEAPAANSAPASAQVGTLTVDESKVIPAPSDILTVADWTGKNCSLDSVDGVAADITVAKSAPHVFRGFLIDKADAAPGPFSIILKGAENYEIPVSTGAARPDVAEFFKNPSLEYAGYEFSTTLSTVPAGKYEVWMLIRQGERSFFCEAGKSITVG